KDEDLSRFGNQLTISFTPHIFRHTYATNLYYAGVDLKRAQYLLGHSSLNMTLKVYTHMDYATGNKITTEKINSFYHNRAV
ncbi:MAG: hypothetical protein E7399_09445, partial [Ruminococcaceae bacterium]|nr:hypothetical protein [Oscillospiraceae bacterium]